MKKIILPFLALMVLMSISAFAVITSVTINVDPRTGFIANNQYNSSGASNDLSVSLNASGAWTNPTNATNMTWIFTSSTNTYRFTNGTINGSRSSTTTGDWTFNISISQLAEGTYTVIAELRNSTEVSDKANSLNSSSVLFTIDRSSPGVTISTPYSGSTVVPNSNLVSFDYTPTDTNMGNCSFFLNNQNIGGSKSGTTSPNASSGLVSRFTYPFSNDNNSVRVAVNCIDLAGLRTASNAQNNFTFNVLAGALSPAQRQAQIAESGRGSSFAVTPLAQNNAMPGTGGFSASGQSSAGSGFSGNLQNYGWMYLVGIIIITALIYRFKNK